MTRHCVGDLCRRLPRIMQKSITLSNVKLWLQVLTSTLKQELLQCRLNLSHLLQMNHTNKKHNGRRNYMYILKQGGRFDSSLRNVQVYTTPSPLQHLLRCTKKIPKLNKRGQSLVEKFQSKQHLRKMAKL
jgi:hypothetical protein